MSLERVAAASVIGSPGGSGGTTRRADPHADLQAVTERNAREVQEEREAEALRAAAAKAAQEEEAAKARADATTKVQAEAAAMAEGALLVTPLRVAAPVAMPVPGFRGSGLYCGHAPSYHR